uniref:Uncharacterized protein n=1 Tax=Oncorhynchus mykiss TaxID=8022 RepID=A0A8K9XFP0_ONCMY
LTVWAPLQVQGQTGGQGAGALTAWLGPESQPVRRRGGRGRRQRLEIQHQPSAPPSELKPVQSLPSKAPKPVSLKEVADIVVRCLDPFYTQGKLAIKYLVLHLSLFQIVKFFSGVKRCESEADWKHLKGPHSTETAEHRGMGGGGTMNRKVEEDNNLGV